MLRTRVALRVYGPLNDFLPLDRRQATFTCDVAGNPSVKDVIESVGIPHPEIELVLANGAAVSFEYAVRDADRIAVFPRFATIDIGALACLRPRPGAIRFVLDVHLGRLARHLRLMGLDTAYRADAADDALAAQASRDDRVLLTRDVGLLKRRVVVHGYFVRETHPHRQLVEVLRRFGPLPLAPFSRCLRCNGALRVASKSAVEATLPPRTREHYHDFTQCPDCRRVYWKGSHFERLVAAVNAALHEAQQTE
jgi:uncharacterized protein